MNKTALWLIAAALPVAVIAQTTTQTVPPADGSNATMSDSMNATSSDNSTDTTTSTTSDATTNTTAAETSTPTTGGARKKNKKPMDATE